MADRESILAVLRSKKWKVVKPNDPDRKIIDRLVKEGRAEWIAGGPRVRATDLPRCPCGQKRHPDQPCPNKAREGHLEPCAWFCYLWHSYVPGSKIQNDNVMLASCARCGRCMPTDTTSRARRCKGRVSIELRGQDAGA